MSDTHASGWLGDLSAADHRSDADENTATRRVRIAEVTKGI
jgi:hypothetical protein